MKKIYIDTREIKKAISILKPDNELFEIRIIQGKRILSGYFEDSEMLIKELENRDLRQSNVYFSLQRLHEGCKARLQYGTFLEVGSTKLPATSDKDIISYEWIPIDLDPVRPAGISSTLEELEESNEIRKQIEAYMQAQGFTKHIQAFSGNGYHLLYRVDWHDVKEASERVKSLLQRLDDLFSTAACHVDGTNYNPARIFKLYGTLAQKGRDTPERPHRISKILGVVT